MAWHPFRNFGLKIVALALGTLLWFTVSGQQADRTVTGVPVVYRNKPSALEITDQTELVDIHVRGLDSQLRNALPRDFEARVDLTGARAGTQTFVLRTDQVSGAVRPRGHAGRSRIGHGPARAGRVGQRAGAPVRRRLAGVRFRREQHHDRSGLGHRRRTGAPARRQPGGDHRSRVD